MAMTGRKHKAMTMDCAFAKEGASLSAYCTAKYRIGPELAPPKSRRINLGPPDRPELSKLCFRLALYEAHSVLAG